MRKFNRNEAVQFLLHQLKQVPNRDVCRKATEEEVKMIIEQTEIDFQTLIDEFICHEDMELTISEVPVEFRFELVMYISLFSKYVTDYDFLAFECEIFDNTDKETVHWIYNVVRAKFKLNDICMISIQELLDYAKSDKPDF